MTCPPGPLHPLPVPDKIFESIALDFMGPLPMDNGYDMIVSMMDCLGADLQLVACNTMEEFMVVLFS